MTADNSPKRLSGALVNAWRMRWPFLITFLLVFFFSLSTLIALDWVPESDTATSPEVTLSTPLVSGKAPLSPNAADAFAIGAYPVRIQIPSIGVNMPISNPSTTNVGALDNYLLKGVVRYPTSGLLGITGNVVLFGHSAEYYPIVNNPAYKAFDGIEKLHPGDTITVYSSDRAYEYSVETVAKKNASEDGIPLTVSGQVLTLSTCDTFGKKTDRYVVTATFVESHLIGK